MTNAFIALDFETANYKPTSVCAVGMVKVEGHSITETFQTLVNPNDYFSERNIDVHGILPEHVTTSPRFSEVYPHMLNFIGDLPVVAHNAPFDMTVLHASIEALNAPIPDMTYFCSLQLSRRTVDAPRYGLNHMMRYYNLDFHGHHDALNDAKACAMITFRLLKHYDSLDQMLDVYGKSLKDKKPRKK